MLVLGVVVGLLILLSSAVLPVVVARYEHLHTATNYHISALCVSDCVMGLALLTYGLIRMAWLELGLHPGFCVVLVFVFAFCSSVSIWEMFWLAMDRLTAMRHPLTYPLLVTVDTVRQEMLLSVLSSLILMSFTMAMRLLTGPPLPDMILRCFAARSLIMGDWGTLPSAVHLVIALATVALAVDVLLVARRVLRANVVAVPQDLTTRAKMRQHLRTFYYLLRVFVLYGVCMMPYPVYSLTKTLLNVSYSEDGDPVETTLLLFRGLFYFFDLWLYSSDPELRHAILHFCFGSHFELYP